MDAYWRNINAVNINGVPEPRDPGVPFSNGGSYFVHQWGNAFTQEFSNVGVPGSILQPLSGGATAAYYVRDKIWSKYLQKEGPNSIGPGLPINDEHPWNTGRGVRNQAFNYKTVNFERGAITYNDYEGAVYLPNCNADGIYTLIDSGGVRVENWAKYWTERMVRRFAISNDLDGPNTSCTVVLPDGTTAKCTRYNNNWIHPDQAATRGQIAQILMFAEGYPYYTDPGYEFPDVVGHWARPWVRIAASRGIIGGYGNGNFGPDDLVTRGQFSKMLVGARGWPLYSGTNQVFSDVPYGSTFYPYIMTAYQNGVISGYSDGTFRVNNNVSRAQITKMVDISVSSPHTPFAEPGICW